MKRQHIPLSMSIGLTIKGGMVGNFEGEGFSLRSDTHILNEHCLH